MATSVIGFVLTIVLAFAFSSIVSQRMRDKLIPLVFAFIIWAETTGTYFTLNAMFYYATMLLLFISSAFVLSDYKRSCFGRNPALVAFLVFWAWYGLPGLWHDYVKEDVRMILVVLRLVMVGYVVGCWALRTYGGMERLMMFAVGGITIAALQFVQHGSWNVEALSDSGGRSVLSESFAASNIDTGRTSNVNALALMTTALLPYLACYLLNAWKTSRAAVFKCLGAFAALVISLMIIRTGSRNGGLALLAVVAYALLGKTSLKGWKRTALLVLLGLSMSYMLVRFVGRNEMRAFQFVTDNESNASSENLGSGRWGFFLDVYDSMSPEERIWGGGPPYEILYDIVGRPQLHIANRHSVYMQVLNTSGWIGVVVMMLFFVRFVLSARTVGIRGHVALLFFGIWALTGVGESANIIGGGKALYALGFALALCSKNRSVVRDEPFSRSNRAFVRFVPQRSF